jgi:uncharacterized membrane protein HdeD (DUF308 family)
MIPLDKQAHFLAGYAIAITLAATSLASAAVAVGSTAAVGGLKELWDHYHPQTNTRDVWDFVATALGGVCGVAAFLGIGLLPG